MKRVLFLTAWSLALALFAQQTISPATPNPPPSTEQIQSPQLVLQSLMSAFNRHDFAALDRVFAT
jgi:hypothetical protein